jgi:hypothetical protein
MWWASVFIPGMLFGGMQSAALLRSEAPSSSSAVFTPPFTPRRLSSAEQLIASFGETEI